MSRNAFIAAAWTLLFFGQCALAADSADWRSWRGPLGGGSVEQGNFPVKFGADKYLWRAELPGRGCSTPILLQDNIYLTSSADGHVEQGDHDPIRMVLAGEVAQHPDQPADVVDSIERRLVGGPVAWEWLVGEGLLECSELCTEIHGGLLGVGLSEAMVRFGVPGDVPGQVPDSVPDQGFLFPMGAL